MAKRPVFIPVYEGDLLVKTIFVEFIWYPGMSVSQKMKSVASLHEAAVSMNICQRPLEVSSKSSVTLGVSLSAFNLKTFTEKHKREFSVESAYQSSKKFERGGPYKDLMFAPSLVSKRDPRLKDSGALIGFEFYGEKWGLEPKTAFYDWLYINALKKNEWAFDLLEEYDAFTDIEFNPEKSINCQAYSVALFKSLAGRGLLKKALESKESFLAFLSHLPVSNASENTVVQPRLV